MLTGRNGGWPLTMFLTPEQLPFYGGTYFPNVSRYGMPAFPELLQRVRAFYDQHPDDVRAQGAELSAALARTSPSADRAGEALSAEPLDLAFEYLDDAFDERDGGFGGAPKFPHPDSIELLLRRYAAKGDARALEMAVLTLRRMAEGGIYDQLGGGFSRYSVDERWAIPHFEKMLYDNGWLLSLYADAWAVTSDPLFARVCGETCAWVMREMQSPGGGYYSSLDADSEGEEGKYYVWSVDEARGLLDAKEFAVASRTFGFDGAPNFEGHAWHPVVARPVDEADAASRRTLDSARAKLLAARDKRVRPGRDEKVLASWNALMIRGMAHAARIFDRGDWLASARRALDFVRRDLWKDGKLLATARDGRAHLDAYLDDHAYLLAALLEMLEADFDPRDLAWAREVAEVLLARFHDREDGGFFFTSHGHEALIHRPKPGPDNATPSGNAVAATALNRLAFVGGDMRYAEAARGTVELFFPAMRRHAASFGTMLGALEELLQPPATLILAGTGANLGEWRDLLRQAYLPTTLVLQVGAHPVDLPEWLAKPQAPGVQAWLCKGTECLPPFTDPDRLRESLSLPKIAPSIARDPPSRSPP
jgi:hypothetical protein